MGRHDSRVTEEGGFGFRSSLSDWVPGGFSDLRGEIVKNVADLMQKAMDGAWARHEVLANNAANAETPGYKRLELDFRGALQEAEGAVAKWLTTNPRHLTPTGNRGPWSITQDRSSITPDGNSVDIDREMAEVSTNALYYSAVSSQMNAYLSLLRKAITEGRR